MTELDNAKESKHTVNEIEQINKLNLIDFIRGKIKTGNMVSNNVFKGNYTNNLIIKHKYLYKENSQLSHKRKEYFYLD